MKRSTWLAVLLTGLVLLAAGQLPRLPWDDLAGRGREALAARIAAWPRLARRTPVPMARPAAAAPAHSAPRPAPRPVTAPIPPDPLPMPFGAPPMPLASLAEALAGALASLGALAALVTARRRDPRGTVWQLARRGLPPSRIAPRARVPQDAVRTLLTPGVGARR